VPNARDEIVLGHDALSVLHEIDKQIKDLWLDVRGRGVAPAQLAPTRVEHVAFKQVLHVFHLPVRSRDKIRTI
jgi:hypothetical protein